MEYVYFKNKKPVKYSKIKKETNVDASGTGWMLCDLYQFMKPEIKFEDNKWILYESATQEEIEALQQQKQLEQIEELNAKFERDGQRYYNEMKQRLTVMLIGKENAMAIMAEIKQSIDPMLNQIKVGNYPFALLDYMDGQNNPTIPEVVDLFNEIGQYVSDYYANEYPH